MPPAASTPDGPGVAGDTMVAGRGPGAEELFAGSRTVGIICEALVTLLLAAVASREAGSIGVDRAALEEAASWTVSAVAERCGP